jgi:exodeoxyribonuclease V alpha subunit
MEHIEAMKEILTQQRKAGIDWVWDCQVIVAVNEKSRLSRKVVNEELQNFLNTNPKIPGSPFRLDDKIVNTKNGYCARPRKVLLEHNVDGEVMVNQNDEIYAANGEIGRVIRAEPKYLECKLETPKRHVLIPRGVNNWELAYAVSCWKAQGSEWPVIIGLIDDYPGARRLCSREYWYTLVSRAKKFCYLVGELSIVQSGCRQTAIQRRKTFLMELIRERINQ